MSSHRAVSPQVYRRRRIVVFGGLGIVLALLGYLPLTLLAPLPTAAVAITAPDEPAPAVPDLDLPESGAMAIAAVGYPGLLAQSGSTESTPIMSIVKVVTALVVLDAHPLDAGESGPVVTMSAADVQIYRDYVAQNASIAPVRAGIELSERQLLELTLVKSAANYASSLVTWAYGSEAAFVDAANAWLAARGLAITIVEPTGLDPANVGTPEAVVELGRIALAHPVVAEIVSMTSISIPEVGDLPNTNVLLGQNGIDGIKTGTLEGYGANLLFSADYEIGDSRVTVVGVVLGGPDHPTIRREILDLLSTVAANFTEIEVAAAGEPFAIYDSIWGGETHAVAAERATLITWAGEPVLPSVEVDDIRVGDSGARVGSVLFTSGPNTVTVELELSVDLHDPGPWWRLTNPAALF